MYMLVSAIHSLNDTAAKDMYVSECQDASKFNHTLVQGNLLICSYSIRFVLGLSTIKQASETAMNLSAAGVVFAMDPFVISYQLNPVPMRLPGIIIPSPDDSKVSLDVQMLLVSVQINMDVYSFCGCWYVCTTVLIFDFNLGILINLADFTSVLQFFS